MHSQRSTQQNLSLQSFQNFQQAQPPQFKAKSPQAQGFPLQDYSSDFGSDQFQSNSQFWNQSAQSQSQQSMPQFQGQKQFQQPGQNYRGFYQGPFSQNQGQAPWDQPNSQSFYPKGYNGQGYRKKKSFKKKKFQKHHWQERPSSRSQQYGSGFQQGFGGRDQQGF
jgi:hypothetical protein